MKFGFIKEQNKSHTGISIFSPDALKGLQLLYPEIDLKVESSDISVFSDDNYRSKGIEVAADMTDCTVFFAINNLSINTLMEGKSYFLFSFYLKEILQNRSLLKAVLLNKIDFYSFEIDNKELTDLNENEGILGAYNAIRAFGIKFELFKLPKAESLLSKDVMISYLKRLILPPLKIVVTGHGKESAGVIEVLDAIKIKKVAMEDFLNKNYTQSVYIQIDVLDYFKRKDGKILNSDDFYKNAQDYISDFKKFTVVSDIFINTNFYTQDAPIVLTQEMLQDVNCKIKVVANIGNDLNNSIAGILRKSTAEDPFYGYLPIENKEVDWFHPGAIVVMTTNNLRYELSKVTIEDFYKRLTKDIIPAFFNNDKNKILQNARISEKGKLTPKFIYLQDYLDIK